MNYEFKLCAVIPVYKHGYVIKETIQKILSYNVPIIVIDDGNTEPDKTLIKNAVKDFPGVDLISLPKNQGKGWAVIKGLSRAKELGYTHAFQIDADGQHDLSSIPFFEKAARKKPKNVIAGFPTYNETVPKSREQGRKITNFWVMIETLSLDILDSMCGFRIYPIQLVSSILDKKFIDFRMGFDIEILVRLHWKGAKFNFYPIKVDYPENAVSNFNVIHDNIKISKTHTCLFFGMLFRLPKILSHKIKRQSKK